MMMLKTAWNEVTKKIILNFFRKSEITVEAQTGAVNDHGDSFNLGGRGGGDKITAVKE